MNEIKLLNKRTVKYPVNENIFTDENDISFYLLGTYMTDGWIDIQNRRKKFQISSIDKEWMISFRDIISPTRKIQESLNKNSLNIQYKFSCVGIYVINWLISYGCTPKKSLTLRLAKSIPETFFKDFVRGCNRWRRQY